jgi:predicted nucleotidyltransferase
MKKVENKEQLIAVIFKNRLTLTERFGVSDIAVFGSYA